MKIITNTLCLLALLLSISEAGNAQDNLFFTNEQWEEHPLPLSPGILQNTAVMGQPWVVSNESEKLSVKPHEHLSSTGDSTEHTFDRYQHAIKGYKGVRYVCKLNSGDYLVGYNGWASGGSVWWFNEAADSGYQVCAGLAIKGIVELDGKIFVIDGHERVDRAHGQMIYLDKNAQKKWVVTRTIRLSSAPLCFTVDNNRAYILTDKDVIRFTADRGTKLFFKSPVYWGMLAPNSVIIKNSDLYIGALGGVFSISNFTGFEDPLNKEWEMRWFKPAANVSASN